MCILFIYTKPNPAPGKYQLILATNRDEYFVRPAQPAHYWAEDKNIIGGKDMEVGREGGTWFGISLRKTEKFKIRMATLLSVTGEPRMPDKMGRGCVVTNYLKSDMTATDYIETKIKPHAKNFNAFNFVAVELNNIPKVIQYSNVSDEIINYLTSENLHGFGNSPANEPFAKVIAGKQRLLSTLTENKLDDVNKQNDLTQELLNLLKWKEAHLPDPVLSRRAPSTYQYLSAIFVNVGLAGYGTRTHSLVLVDSDGNVEFLEETMDTYNESGEQTWIQNKFTAKI